MHVKLAATLSGKGDKFGQNLIKLED